MPTTKKASIRRHAVVRADSRLALTLSWTKRAGPILWDSTSSGG